MGNGSHKRGPADADRIRELGAKHARALQRAIDEESGTGDWEETSEVKIPSSAPPRIRAFLGLVSGLTPRGRLVLLLALIAALTFLTWSFGPAVLGVVWRG